MKKWTLFLRLLKHGKSHGLSIIENPTYRANQKYSDWLARQNGVSWKTRLCDEIDKIVLREDVRTVEDLAEQLRKKYYAVTLKKYLSIKVSENRKAIRSYRLGDGYAIEELPYVNFHALRHMFATNCVALGFDVKTLSEILGHSSVQITLNRYVHSSMERKKSCMKLFSDSIAA